MCFSPLFIREPAEHKTVEEMNAALVSVPYSSGSRLNGARVVPRQRLHVSVPYSSGSRLNEAGGGGGPRGGFQSLIHQGAG